MKQILLISVITTFVFGWFGCSHFEKNFGIRTVSSVQDVTTAWSYDPGPAPETPMGKELIDIVASQPYMPGISKELTGDQKFRPAFGPTLWRMIQEPNSIKILFIGQDGTHIAEAAGRTATAGFGGRAQDMAAHFGVETSAAFMNAFAFTIKGQYSGYGAPVISEINGVKKVSFDSIVDNGIWMMAQDQNSPMVKWRNSLIDWIIRNNKDSLRLVVLFGGSAQDAIGTFIESHGGKVGAKYSVEDLLAKKIKVPVFISESGGSNKEVPVAVTKAGKNIFTEMGITVPYRDASAKPGTPALENYETKLQEAKEALAKNIDQVYPKLAISNGGAGKSGILHPAQIGGYDLGKIFVNDKKTISLKGLKLSDGSTIGNDVLVAEFPHPTSLSASPGTAPAKVEKSLALLKPYAKAGWEIEPDKGRISKFEKDEPYVYGRADIGPAFYDFGTPNNRMVSVSSASRLSPNVVVIGTRDRATFDTTKMAAATNAKPAAGISNEELFSARPRTPENRYVFDMGPGEKMAKIMKQNLNVALIGKMKSGKDANSACKDPEASSNFNIKTHPLCVGDFGHYRGTFDKPKIVILADPDGVDDILTSRALTGTRGQYLHGLMQDIGVDDNYLVIKTVPFGMDGATDAEWNVVLSQTSAYRQKIFEAVMGNGKVELVIADGKYAAQELAKLKLSVPQVTVNRVGSENNSGIKEASAEINKLKKFNTFTAKAQMANIPRSHLGFFSRVWEGTSGTRVLDSNSAADAGSAFAIIVPSWVYEQKNVVQDKDEREAINSLKDNLEQNALPRADEKFIDFIKRHGGTDSSYKLFLNFLNIS